MADKMIRMGGRDSNGYARAVKTNEEGMIYSQDYVDSIDIINEEITIKPKEKSTVKIINSFRYYTISGRVTSGHKTIGVHSSDFQKGATLSSKIDKEEIENGRFMTTSKQSKTDRMTISFTNYGEEDLVISNAYINTSDSSDSLINKIGSLSDDKPVTSKDIVDYTDSLETPIKIGESQEFMLEDVKKSITISGRLSIESDIEIYYVPIVVNNYTEPVLVFKSSTTNSRFVTNSFRPSTKDIKLIIKNVHKKSYDVTVSHLFMNSVQGGKIESSGGKVNSGGGMSVTDLDGESISLTAVEDEEGNGVLRTVNSAPQAYDIEKDVLKVVILGEQEKEKDVDVNLSKHTTEQLVFDDEKLAGKKEMRIEIAEDSRFGRGKKGVLFFKGIDDNHDIYIETRVGASGLFYKDEIVSEGVGASYPDNTQKVVIPDDVFPVFNYGKSKNFSSYFVVKAKTGDLSKLRMYLVMM